MTLSDVVSGSGLTLFPLVALVIFFLLFVGIAVYVMLRRRETWERTRRLPLEDDGRASGEENGR